MANAGVCTKEGCQATAGGACLEGFTALVECPNYSLEESHAIDNSKESAGQLPENGTAADEQVDRTEKKAHISLHSGNALTGPEARPLAASSPTTVIVFAGMVSSGKTTVLAEIYERFRSGSFVNHLFAGSRTILGFERICHYARAASEGSTEKTARTIRDLENNLLHFDLVEKGTRIRKRLLITDLSGEHFDDATYMSDRLRDLPYVSRANHFILFVDSAKLALADERQVLANQVLVLLRGCIEEKLLSESCRLTVAFSRHDLASSGDDLAGTKDFQDNMRNRIEKRVSGFLDEPPRFLELAARPKNIDSPEYGLEELMSIMTDLPKHGLSTRLALSRDSNMPIRQIDSLAFKELINE